MEAINIFVNILTFSIPTIVGSIFFYKYKILETEKRESIRRLEEFEETKKKLNDMSNELNDMSENKIRVEGKNESLESTIKSLESNIKEIKDSLGKSEKEKENLLSEKISLEKTKASLEEKLKRYNEFELHCNNMLQEGLSKHINEKFSELHKADKKKLESDTEGSLRNFLNEFEKNVKETENSIKSVGAINQALSEGIKGYHNTAEKCTNAVQEYNSMLFGEKRKNAGLIGESIVEDILESAGLKKDIHYYRGLKYECVGDKEFEGGKDKTSKFVIPDFVVNLPGSNKKLVVDAKTLSTANDLYIKSTEANTSKDKNNNLKESCKEIDKVVKELGQKRYFDIEDSVAEFVLMFVPYPDLAISYNIEKRNFSDNCEQSSVYIVSTGDLIIAIRTIGYFYKTMNVGQNFKTMQSSMKKLYSSLYTLAENVNKVSTNINQLNTSQSSVIKYMNKDIAPPLEEFIKIGAAPNCSSNKHASCVKIVELERKKELPLIGNNKFDSNKQVDTDENNKFALIDNTHSSE